MLFRQWLDGKYSLVRIVRDESVLLLAEVSIIRAITRIAFPDTDSLKFSNLGLGLTSVHQS